jgi:myo-inositol-1(or 4)-monophosphatase
MDERQRGAMVNAVQAAGKYLRDSNGNKKTPYELEKRSRDIMLRELRSAMPQISIWGDDERKDRTIAICPLDAQVNFGRRMGPYGTMAALIEGDAAVFGALYLPESEDMLVAERGKGARLNGKKVESNGRGDLSKALVCCGCNIYNEDMVPLSMGAIEALARNAIIWRNLGSPVAEFIYLATGKIDGLVVPMLETAHAAGYLAMQEAGAVVTGTDGKPYTLRSGSIIAAGAGLHQDLFDLLKDSL